MRKILGSGAEPQQTQFNPQILPKSPFYKWRKKLQQLAPVATETSRDATDRVTPVRLVASAGVAVRLPGGTQLDIPAADPQLLQLAIQTLAQADAQHKAGGQTC